MRYKILILGCLLGGSVQAEPVVNTDTEYYIVDGTDAASIREDMNAKRPGKYDAYTSWKVKWRFYWNNQKNSCVLTDVKTDVAIKFTLPKLAKNNQADQYAKRRWNNYYRALIAHENGHRDFGVEAATEIETALLSMGQRSNCKTLETEANELAHDIIAKYGELNKQYDADTRHGMNDGAVFP
jgi:predicted secreted Zn-dependent protease